MGTHLPLGQRRRTGYSGFLLIDDLSRARGWAGFQAFVV
jgi:hypothetical protein